MGEVQRLFHREGLSKAGIARRLGMSRTTVIRLLALGGPPRYARDEGSRRPLRRQMRPARHRGRCPATVILERLRRSGYRGGITSSRSTSRGCARVPRRPGVPAHDVPARRDRPARRRRPAYWCRWARRGPRGVRSRAHAAPLGCACGRLHARSDGRGPVHRAPRLPPSPRRRARADRHDNDASIVAEGAGRRARLHPEVLALLGQLHTKAVPLAPRPRPRGQWSAPSATSRRASCPCAPSPRSRTCRRADVWATETAFTRTLRRTAPGRGPLDGGAWLPPPSP